MYLSKMDKRVSFIKEILNKKLAVTIYRREIVIDMFKTWLTKILYLLDWKCDQYRWSCNGKKKLPKKSPIIEKIYYQVELRSGKSDSFKKEVYELLEGYAEYVLNHYKGKYEYTN